MKSLLIISTVPGALSGFLLPFVNYFRAEGWRVEGMAQEISKCDRCVAAFEQVWDIEWSRNPLNPRNLFIAAPRVREIVVQGNYDIVHVHTPVASFVTRYALKNLRGKQRPLVFYTAHGFHFHNQGSLISNTIFRTLETIAGQWTDYLITINKEDETAAKKYRLLPPEKIFYTPGIGVDTSHYNRDRVSTEEITAIHQELGLQPTDSLLLCVAEFTPNKRHQDQLQALKKLNRPEIHLAFAGDGTIRPQLEQLTAELSLTKQVHFLGFRPDIPQLICASKGILLTSQREGLPRSIMEALCLATPVIGTKTRGIRDLLSDNCGFLIDVGDTDALAQAIADIIDHPQKAHEMGQRGRQKMTHYDVNNIIKMYSELYELAFKNR